MQKQPKHKIGDTVTLTLNNFSWYDEMRIEHKGKFENFESYIIDIKSLQKDEREHVNDQIKEINSKTIIAKILGGYLQKNKKTWKHKSYQWKYYIEFYDYIFIWNNHLRPEHAFNESQLNI